VTKLVWDQSGAKVFEAGLDRGVVYFADEPGVAWNGLVSLDESDRMGYESYIFDGEKIGNLPLASGFSGSLTAFTYPPEFLKAVGSSINDDISGLQLMNQKGRVSFGLSYRSLIGDDIDGINLGYKIHILYNLTAVADDIDYETLSDDIDPLEFKWSVSGRMETLAGYKPTAHVIVDSRYLSEVRMDRLEEILYGTETSEPWLPDLATLYEMLNYAYLVTIVDNGNGTWTAMGPSELITMLDATTFEIESDGVTIIDPDTYTIESA